MRLLPLAFLACVSASAEPTRAVLVQELVRLEAMERKTVVMFPLAQQDAQLEIKFTSKRGGEGVRVAVYAEASNIPVASTTYELTGELRAPLTREGQYRVEIENQRQRLGHALVDLDVSVVFGLRPAAPPASSARTLEPRRRLYTLIVSWSLFAIIVAYSAIRLTPPILERWRGER